METEDAGRRDVSALSEGLGPLPDLPPPSWRGHWSAGDMIAFAEAAIDAERERCAKLCDEAARGYEGRGMDMAYAASEWIAAAIRGA